MSGAGTTPVKGGITGIGRGADVIVLAVLTTKVPVSLVLFKGEGRGQWRVPRSNTIISSKLTKPTPWVRIWTSWISLETSSAVQNEASMENVTVTFSDPENGDTVVSVTLVVRSARNCTESK